jgi:three-Cys-motif partner protein
MPPKDVRWKRDAHTAAKHELLRRYLNAWLPIMGRSGNANVLVVDGFAGPGRYEGGEPGSPLVILDAFLNHKDRPAWDGTKFTFAFIEKDSKRFQSLRDEVMAVALPGNADVQVVHGAFDKEVKALLDSIPKGFGLPPSFVFIDPFGWKDAGLDLSSRILGFPKCEVLIYVPLPHIARFVGEDEVKASLENLYGDDSWLPARELEGAARDQFLHDQFLKNLKTGGRFARSFEIDPGGKGKRGYHLFFGSKNITGLDKMKYAMWQVDPVAGVKFADSTSSDQLVMFEVDPDLKPLEDALRAHFGEDDFTIEQAAMFTLTATPYHPGIHLKKSTLKPAERDGRIEAWDRKMAGTYPSGTRLRFRPESVPAPDPGHASGTRPKFARRGAGRLPAGGGPPTV